MSSTLKPLRRQGTGSRRLAALGAAAVTAFGGGAAIGALHEPDSVSAARAFVEAWAREDFAAMHARLTPGARERTPLDEFTQAYADAADTLTLQEVSAGDVSGAGADSAEADVSLRTRMFGTISGALRLPAPEAGDAAAIDWRPHHVFPGLRRGQSLERTTSLPPRADLLARDGTPLAEGRDRTSPLGAAAAAVAGQLGPIPEDRAPEYAARGVPPDAPVGISGLEREFDARLTGVPGGELRAGDLLIAEAEPRAGEPVTTTIDPDVQQAGVDALAGRYGGIAVLAPGTGEVLGMAGIAASGTQPPGSTFKIVTLAGALDAGVTRPGESFPVQTSATLSGVELQNANGEACGGSLRESFARSCNSVFGPLGVELGPERLLDYSEAFGFNEEPSLSDMLASTMPPAEEMGDDLGVGAHAIGQGRSLSTTVHMASVAATIANEGMRMRPTLLLDDRDEAGAAVGAHVARRVRAMMRAVVSEGTGTAAAIPGTGVAGKTGTAELRTTQPADPAPGEEVAADPSDTTAWFAAFAPARSPRVAVAVMLVGHGAGGATAAPTAREVLEAGLEATAP
jgi:penicillin-binding protein A